MTENNVQIFIAPLWLRVFQVMPLFIFCVIGFIYFLSRVTSGSHDSHIVDIMVLGITVALVVCAFISALQLLTEKITVSSSYVEGKSIFFRNRIPFSKIVDARCNKFGRPANTCLLIETTIKKYKMGHTLSTHDIEMAANFIKMKCENHN